jgi:hypothetical protein
LYIHKAQQAESRGAKLRTNQLNQNILLTGMLPAARDVLSMTTGWLQVVRLLSSTVICNGM